MNWLASIILAASLALLPDIGLAASRLLSEHEWLRIRQIAANCSLTDEQTWLLAAIRRLENGRPGLEFGVGGPMDSGHPAHRHQDGYRSYYVQGAWSAGTILAHYRGNLKAFGRRYCPPRAAFWSSKIAKIIEQLKSENNGQLPGFRPAKAPWPFRDLKN